ncbi:MAG: hypothetical protein CML06_08040 [Pseudomonadales bacterium]|nr:hypothetical protein [Pseudomonadales bacterium]
MKNLYQALIRRLRALPLPLLILGGTLLVLVLLFALQPAPPKKPATEILPLVRTVPAEPGSHRPMVTLYGRLESPREASLAATINAFVDQVQVEEGQWVEPGQLLVQLDDSEVRLSYEQRQAELEDLEAQVASEQARFKNDRQALQVEQELVELSEKSLQRYEQLVERNVGSDLSRDEARQQARAQALSLLNRKLAVSDHPNRLQRLQAQLKRARVQRDQAALDLARTRVVAPFAGRVTAVPAVPGNRVRPGDVLVRLFDAAHVQVRAQIPSRYLNPVETALDRNQTLDARFVLGERRLPLRLSRLSGAIEAGQGGVDALFDLAQQPRHLTLGRAGEVYLQLPPVADTLALPPTAIYGQQRIYRVEDGTLHTVMVERLGEVLAESGEQLQLVRAEGISAGIPILITQLSNAVGGLKVRPQQQQAAGDE